MPRTIEIETTWRARHTIEVADDYEAADEGGLDFGEDADGNEIAELLTAAGAELVDWTIL